MFHSDMDLLVDVELFTIHVERNRTSKSYFIPIGFKIEIHRRIGRYSFILDGFI